MSTHTLQRLQRFFEPAFVAVWIALAVRPSIVLAQSPCAEIRDTGTFTGCVLDTANFECRQSRSLPQLQACFRSQAIALLGNRAYEVETLLNQEESYRRPLNFECVEWFFPGLFNCHLIGGDWGAPEEWCFRNDANTVSWCEGDPPKHKCKRISCPLASCNTSREFSRCSMVWNPAAK
jgi:hypothetical protein